MSGTIGAAAPALKASDRRSLQRRLLAWYDRSARDLPWRTPPAPRRAEGEGRPDPYRVWLSEIMLQQTTTVHAAPYFLEFTRRWPTVADLAGAEDAEVMAAWAGLGYYARARNLLRCARQVRDEGGRFPADEAALRRLPGIGPYTAAAIAAIAFDLPAGAVDGNIERVFARLFALSLTAAELKAQARRIALALVPSDRPGDHTQALMDLGALVCRPRAPACDVCPLSGLCAARSEGRPEAYPFRPPRPEKPLRRGRTFLFVSEGEVGLARRPARGLFGGMMTPPADGFEERAPGAAGASPAFLAGADPGTGPVSWRSVGGVRHVFTHFVLDLEVLLAEIPRARRPAELTFVPMDAAEASAPSLFRKAMRLARGADALVPPRSAAHLSSAPET